MQILNINNEIDTELPEELTVQITSLLTMTFLLRTLRDWLLKLDAIALQNPALSNPQN